MLKHDNFEVVFPAWQDLKAYWSNFNPDNLVLSTGLIIRIVHRKEIRKLTFRALALRRSELDSLRRRANARNVSFRISLRWTIHIINQVDKTKLSCNTLTDAAPQFL